MAAPEAESVEAMEYEQGSALRAAHYSMRRVNANNKGLARALAAYNSSRQRLAPPLSSWTRTRGAEYGGWVASTETGETWVGDNNSYGGERRCIAALAS